MCDNAWTRTKIRRKFSSEIVPGFVIYLLWGLPWWHHHDVLAMTWAFAPTNWRFGIGRLFFFCKWEIFRLHVNFQGGDFCIIMRPFFYRQPLPWIFQATLSGPEEIGPDFRLVETWLHKFWNRSWSGWQCWNESPIKSIGFPWTQLGRLGWWWLMA